MHVSGFTGKLLFWMAVPLLVSFVWLCSDTSLFIPFLPWTICETDKKPVVGKCADNYFKLPGMEDCHLMLDCEEINKEIDVQEIVGFGAVKIVRRGVWTGHSVAVNTLANPAFRDDFLHGLEMLRLLQPTVRVTQLVGSCERTSTYVTEFHHLGSATGLEQVLQTEEYESFDNLTMRFGLCVQYAQILHSLHTQQSDGGESSGARVMCDSNDVDKTLSQFLLRNNLSLVLNDVDALPLANKNKGQLIKCGHQELFGEFVAPEQLWPFGEEDFDDSRMPGYDEKSDIWKVPDVCDVLLGTVDGVAKLRLHLLPLHLKCKMDNPSDRPSAKEIVEFYENVRTKLQL